MLQRVFKELFFITPKTLLALAQEGAGKEITTAPPLKLFLVPCTEQSEVYCKASN